MSDKLILILALNAASVTSIVCAFILALKRREGWGWLLVVACLMHVSNIT